MYNPMHPGEFIQSVYLEPFNVSRRELARKLKVDPATVSRLVAGQSRVTEEMALRLSMVLGRSPESWLNMQNQYSLWEAKEKVDADNLSRLELTPA